MTSQYDGLTFKQLIKAARTNKRLTTLKLANELGLEKKGLVEMWQSEAPSAIGVLTPEAMLPKLAEALDIPFEYLKASWERAKSDLRTQRAEAKIEQIQQGQPKALSQIMKRLRLEARKSQAEIGQIINVGSGVVSIIEAGNKVPEKEQINQFIAALDLKADDVGDLRQAWRHASTIDLTRKFRAQTIQARAMRHAGMREERHMDLFRLTRMRRAQKLQS